MRVIVRGLDTTLVIPCDDNEEAVQLLKDNPPSHPRPSEASVKGNEIHSTIHWCCKRHARLHCEELRAFAEVVGCGFEEAN
jgi:hypothetical protein